MSALTIVRTDDCPLALPTNQGHTALTLLCWNLKTGLGYICDFLGHNISSIPFSAHKLSTAHELDILAKAILTYVFFYIGRPYQIV